MNIRLSNLHLSYGQRHVLDGVSLGPLERGRSLGCSDPTERENPRSSRRSPG